MRAILFIAVLGFVCTNVHPTMASPSVSAVGGVIGGLARGETITTTHDVQKFLIYERGKFKNITNKYGNSVAPAYRDPYVGVRVIVDNDFTVDEQEKIKRAAKLFITQYLLNDVLTCTYHAMDQKKITPPWTLRRFSNEMLFLFRHYSKSNQLVDSRTRRLYIEKYDVDANALGLARVGVFTTPDYEMNKVSRLNYFHIGLNTRWFAETDDHYLAGAIAHEILHNLGFIHPILDSTGKADDFIYVYGLCLTDVSRHLH